jgi:GntR family transcriptional regulator
MKLGRLNFDSPLPRHRQVESLLRKLLTQPRHRNGQPLPGEIDIAESLGVSRQTVRQAMKSLESDGLILRKRNAGTVAAPQPIVTRLTDWPSFSAEMSRQGVQMSLLSLVVKVAVAPAPAHSFFKLPARSRALCVTRLRGDASGPVVEFQSWLHPRLKLAPTDDFTGPLYDLITRRSGALPTHSHERLGAAACDARLARALAVKTGTPLLTRTREVSDARRLPVEWCQCYYRADRFQYSVQLHRDSQEHT